MSDIAQLLGIAKEKDAEIKRLQKELDNAGEYFRREWNNASRYRKALDEIGGIVGRYAYQSTCLVDIQKIAEEATTND